MPYYGWYIITDSVTGPFEQAPAIGVTSEVVVACKVGYATTIRIHLWAFVAKLTLAVEGMGCW